MRVNKRISRRFRWKVSPIAVEINYEKDQTWPVLLFDLREKKVHKCFSIRSALSVIVETVFGTGVANKRDEKYSRREEIKQYYKLLKDVNPITT